MMRQYELVERVASYKPDPDETLLNKAYVYAMQKHGTQKRASGDPYFSHPLEVAAILTDLKLDEETVAVALLHDTIEDTDATRKEIDSIFGERIGRLVEGLTKIKKLDLVSQKAKQAENLRRFMLAVSDDVRVLLVKLADRLHNMRTLHYVKPEKRGRISQETMEFYAPLAGRMGMQSVREELEDLSFCHLYPDAYTTITDRLKEMASENRTTIEKIAAVIEAQLAECADNITVSYRQKSPFSIFKKMERKELTFDKLYDIFGFRVYTHNVAQCYQVLGLIHTRWPMVPGRFKDFISTPKQNGYQSLHTAVVGPSNQRVELQIRTHEMHQIATYGVAAHAHYKDTEIFGGDPYADLRTTIAQLAQNPDPEQFLEHTKLELFHDQVFCFTPKGRIIALPHGATPIDFAYAVHTDLGNSCVGCKIDGKLMPVVTKLRNGNEVEIIRSKDQTPPAAWLDVVATGKAQAAIRKASREAVRKQYSGLGVRLLQRSFDKVGRDFGRDMLEPALKKLSRTSIEDLLADVGRGELEPHLVIEAVFPDYKAERVTQETPTKEDGWFAMAAANMLKFRHPLAKKGKGQPDQTGSLPIRGVNTDLPVRFSPDSGAVPGDRIVGILEEGVGITIYPIQAAQLLDSSENAHKWIDVKWDLDPDSNVLFQTKISLNAKNEPGALGIIAETIGKLDCNIKNLTMSNQNTDFTAMEIELEVWDLNHLETVIDQLGRKAVVNQVKRELT